MTRASILTLQPNRGGVPALARAVYRLVESGGHQPSLVYRAQDDVPVTSRFNILKYFFTTPPVRRFVQDSMAHVAVTDYPVPARYQYHLLRLADQDLKVPIAAVVSGSSHVGLPLALANRPYVLWVATLYDEELRSRGMAGDRWASEFLGHPHWPALEAQEQLVYKRASVILSLSHYTTEQIGRRWPTLVPKLQTVIYPIDTDLYQPDEPDTNSPYLVFVARLRDPRKNIKMMLHAFALIHAQMPHMRLVLAGDEPSPEIIQLLDELHLKESVDFPGHVKADSIELVRLYQRATIFVLPSLQEGLCIAALEAMACGLPIVSTRCGGPESLVQQGVTGLLVSNNDPEAFANAVIDLLHHRDRAQAMGRAGRSLAVRQFSREQVVSQLQKAFKGVFSKEF